MTKYRKIHLNSEFNSSDLITYTVCKNQEFQSIYFLLEAKIFHILPKLAKNKDKVDRRSARSSKHFLCSANTSKYLSKI